MSWSLAGYSGVVLDTFEIREGTTLAGRYRVIERLGVGGMATVYLAEDCVLGRRVAVKRMRRGASGRGRHNTERFRREARMGASLSHPNVVTVFDTLAGEDGVLIVMEYVDGEPLAAEIDRGRIPPDRAIAILAAVASALDHAHAAGIVHRDVKPGNVLISVDGNVKLADLGIATAAEATRITSANDIVGTLAYISPERLEDASPGGPEADVYSLAVLAWEMLSGEQLHRGSTPAEVLHRATMGPPPDLRAAWPEAPPELARTLQEALHADPDCRPESAGEFVARLRDSLESTAEEPEPLDPTETMTAPTAIAAETPPPRAPADVLEDRPPTEEPRPAGMARRSRGPRAALLAMAALALAGLAALAVALVGGGDDGTGGGGGERVATSEERGAGGGGSEEVAPAPEEAAPPEETTIEEAAPVDEQPAAAGGDDPAALNDQGFALIQEGDYEGAIPVLQRAVDSYPEGTTDLGYAYALYNLGNALRLAGRPEEAIPVLEQRLEIPDQTSTVERELELARQEAGVE
jgi:tRNA A-37 threonylcarbamoyl transferase component Bud32